MGSGLIVPSHHSCLRLDRPARVREGCGDEFLRVEVDSCLPQTRPFLIKKKRSLTNILSDLACLKDACTSGPPGYTEIREFRRTHLPLINTGAFSKGTKTEKQGTLLYQDKGGLVH